MKLPREQQLLKIGIIAIVNELALSGYQDSADEMLDHSEKLDSCRKVIEFFGNHSNHTTTTYSTLKIFRKLFEDAYLGSDEDYYNFCLGMINDHEQTIISHIIGGDITLIELQQFPLDDKSLDRVFQNE